MKENKHYFIVNKTQNTGLQFVPVRNVKKLFWFVKQLTDAGSLLNT
jgi:hypothetical protein